MYIASEPVVRKHLVHELLYHTGKSADDVLIYPDRAVLDFMGTRAVEVPARR
jgi:hypothetical protein